MYYKRTNLDVTTKDSGKNRVWALDLLRFLAASSVLYYHFYFIGPLQGYWPKDFTSDIGKWGDFGLDLFFVISGFVISLTANGRNAKQFITARFIRIMPGFFVCSTITALMAVVLPGIYFKEIFPRWIASLTLFPHIFGTQTLSSVYWTLTVEVTFYAWVSILIAANIWQKFNTRIIALWIVISLLNQVAIHSSIIDSLFITQFCGHFCAGIIVYRIYEKQPPKACWLLMTLSILLISIHVIGFSEWIGNAFKHPISKAGQLLVAPIIIILVFVASKIKTNPFPNNLVIALGGMSFPFYLIHADLGFWSHAIFERKIFILFPSASSTVTYHKMAIAAILGSVAISWAVAIYVEPYLRRKIKPLIY